MNTRPELSKKSVRSPERETMVSGQKYDRPKYKKKGKHFRKNTIHYSRQKSKSFHSKAWWVCSLICVMFSPRPECVTSTSKNVTSHSLFWILKLCNLDTGRVLNPFRQEDEEEVLAKRTHNSRRWSHVFPKGEIEYKRHAGKSSNWRQNLWSNFLLCLK